jgi:ubiquinone/menaquinone biosynthesis C-methylase UbiE
MADLVGPTGMVLGIDPLRARIAIAKRRAREWLAFDVGDANDLSVLAEASFDVVVLNAVFHWLPDKARPLAEFRRVLKKGGRIGLTTRPPGERTPLQQVRAEVLAEPAYAEHRQALERSLFRVDETAMRTHLKDAGFRKIDVRVVPSEQVFADAETAIRYSEASSFGNFLGHLPEALRDQARTEICKRLEVLRAGQPIVRRGERLVAVAFR